MALIKCPECRKKISDQASACIHCGCPISSMLEQNEMSKPTSDAEEFKQNVLAEDAQGINECVEEHSIDTKKRLKLWHKI